MTGSTNTPEPESAQDDRAISLWNLHRHLTKLADELAGAAREAESHAGNGNRSGGGLASPRAYFEALLGQRRARDRYFGSIHFSEPAWDIMLELMIARIDGRVMMLSELGAESSGPEGSIRGHVDELAAANLIERYDSDEAADYQLALSSEAARRMAEFYRARIRG